jgi:hypothetical protein
VEQQAHQVTLRPEAQAVCLLLQPFMQQAELVEHLFLV